MGKDISWSKKPQSYYISSKQGTFDLFSQGPVKFHQWIWFYFWTGATFSWVLPKDDSLLHLRVEIQKLELNFRLGEGSKGLKDFEGNHSVDSQLVEVDLPSKERKKNQEEDFSICSNTILWKRIQYLDNFSTSFKTAILFHYIQVQHVLHEFTGLTNFNKTLTEIYISTNIQ